tara:strand:- start:132 stop:2306 length:2175 start_codon:yes stop_codon:yes gene_type:complete
MAFDTIKKEFSREHLWYCEIIVDGQTYRFCENITPIPAGLEVDAPSMSKPSIRPAQAALDGGIGVRASASVTFKEHQDYVRFGSLTTPKRFWPSWRANHPGYEGAEISIYSGYIVNSVFNSVNFQKRDFILNSFSHSESGASINGKDTLKLASNERAKAPRKSKGLLVADVAEADTGLTLTPAGVGNSEYPASGWAKIGDEIVSFTRVNDVFTIVRSQYNTLADDHSLNDVFQLCLYYNDTIADINNDLLVNYSGVDQAVIPKAAWDDEASTFIPGLYSALITEPTGVSALLKELSESAPHYMFWDERTNLINFVAIKPPPDTALTLTAEDNLLQGSTAVSDQQDMRISTVLVNFGQYDPTKELDESSNYRQAHVRFNTASAARYNGIEKYKVIYSRWISNDNRASAVRLAARYGRRFEDTPRKIKFKLDAKDSDVWTGAPLFINSDLIVNAAGDRFNMPVQVISVGESESYNYEALEYSYGVALPEDLESEDPNQRLVVLSGELDQLKNNTTPRTLRDIYDGLFPDVLDTYDVVFIFDSNCVAGSNDNTAFSVDTGSWPELTTGDPIKLDVRGLVVGKGGDGANVAGSPENGGSALILNANIRLTNTGIIGGGGGGGDFVFAVGGGAAGGGGAGFVNGSGGTGTATTNSTVIIQAQPGTNTTGGDGGFAQGSGVEPVSVNGGDGGNLGQVGGSGGGTAGTAIDANGYTITYLETGDIRGAVIA